MLYCLSPSLVAFAQPSQPLSSHLPFLRPKGIVPCPDCGRRVSRGGVWQHSTYFPKSLPKCAHCEVPMTRYSMFQPAHPFFVQKQNRSFFSSMGLLTLEKRCVRFPGCGASRFSKTPSHVSLSESMARHVKCCGSAPKTCPHCGDTLPRAKLSEHKNSECPKVSTKNSRTPACPHICHRLYVIACGATEVLTR